MFIPRAALLLCVTLSVSGCFGTATKGRPKLPDAEAMARNVDPVWAKAYPLPVTRSHAPEGGEWQKIEVKPKTSENGRRPIRHIWIWAKVKVSTALPPK